MPITGQDGSYLAELLLNKGYEVHGVIRRASTFNTGRIDHIFQDPHEKNKSLVLQYGDLSDGSNISRLIEKIKPDEIYNLAAQSHVRVSFDIPEYTGVELLIAPELNMGDSRKKALEIAVGYPGVENFLWAEPEKCDLITEENLNAMLAQLRAGETDIVVSKRKTKFLKNWATVSILIDNKR